MSKQLAARFLLSFLCTTVVPTQLWAVDFTWTNVSGGDWFTAGNWFPAAGGPPNAGDNAIFNLPSTMTVRTSALIPDGADSMRVSDGTVTLESVSTFFTSTLNLNTGASDLTVNNNASLIIGSPSRRLTVNVGDLLDIYDGAELAVRSGADLVTNSFRLGIGSTPFLYSNLTIEGAGSTLTVNSPSVVARLGGDGGAGLLRVQSGASASLNPTQIVTGDIYILSGGAVTSRNLLVGTSSTSAAPQSATLLVRDSGSVLDQNEGRLEVNRSGLLEVSNFGVINSHSFGTRVNGGTVNVQLNGTFNANDGIIVSNGGTFGVVGGVANSTTDVHAQTGGTISVRSGRFNVSTNLYVNSGGFAVVDGGTLDTALEANVLAGGKVSVLSGLFETDTLIVDGVGSRFTLDGGELAVSDVELTNGGQLDWRSGTLTATEGTLSVPVSVPFGATLNTGRDDVVKLNAPFFQSMNSTVNVVGKTYIGAANQVNGFVSHGTFNVGAETVTIRDANDAVFDSAALVTLGDATGVGEIVADNGVTLDFGANVTGHGTIRTTNDAALPFINNGHIVGTSAAEPITLTGYIKGVGTLDNVVITGTDAPGFSPATVQRGNTTYAGELQIEIGGQIPGQFDAIHHSGVATLGGTLDVSLLGNFAPDAGDEFEIITAASVVSGFDAELLPAIGGGLFFDVVESATSVVLAVAGVTGDYNLDGTVNAADYTAWRNALGTNGRGLNADGDRSGTIDAADYLAWKSNYGETAAASAALTAQAITVPEPAALALLLPTLLITYRRAKCCALARKKL